MNERYKKFIVGTLFKFVHAPPREGYKEEPREPGGGLLDKIGTVVSGPMGKILTIGEAFLKSW